MEPSEAKGGGPSISGRAGTCCGNERLEGQGLPRSRHREEAFPPSERSQALKGAPGRERRARHGLGGFREERGLRALKKGISGPTPLWSDFGHVTLLIPHLHLGNGMETPHRVIIKTKSWDPVHRAGSRPSKKWELPSLRRAWVHSDPSSVPDNPYGFG